ncbi:MAG: hypothetical protein B6D56_04385 [Candidatus Omnitrophica bacterium 4484_70.1]|nr:MAG: hypothetical protein B6D56_04385 [Candidatus Omnitrophica bacterium 4484_70.1]
MFNSSSRHRLRIVVPAYPTFNIYSSVAKKTTALGPVCVASIVEEMEGWDVEVIDENNFSTYGPRNADGEVDHEFLQNIRRADVVGLYGGLTSTIPRLYKIARFYQNKGIITIAGGQHFVKENIAEGLSSGIDYVVIGEAEDTIKELLWALEGKMNLREVKGIAYREKGKVFLTEAREPPACFDKYPLPKFSLVRYANIKLYPVGRIRGCGMDCEFCTVKGKPRRASPARVLESISLLLETHSARHFFIVDDLFGQYPQETIQLCNMLRDYQVRVQRRIDITVQIRLDKAKDTQLLSAMRKAGVNTVAIGFESPIEEELVAMRKKIKPSEMVELARVYHKFGFLVHGMFIFGYPLKGTKINLSAEERIKRFRKFIKAAKIDTIQVLLPVPLPGTELRERLKEEKRIYPLQDIGWEYYDGNFPLFEPDAPLTAEELQNSIRKIMGKFYQVKYFFMLGYHIFSFPSLIFFFYKIKTGWRMWYRQWRNAFVRFGGWLIMKDWVKEFNKGTFIQKLEKGQRNLRNLRNKKGN